jgi:hypothetical protein
MGQNVKNPHFLVLDSAGPSTAVVVHRAQRPVALLNPPLRLLHRHVSVTVGGDSQRA